MNYKPHPLTKAELERFYVEEGKSISETAKELKTSSKTVCKYLKIHGIASRPFSTKGMKTRQGAVLSEATKEKIRKKRLGQKLSPEHREKVIKSLLVGLKGDANPNWQGGITPINAKIQNRLRQTRDMRIWRKAVLERDRYKCVFCGYDGKKLHVDHIKPFCLFPELRTSIENGRTLCITCHRKTPTYGGRIRKK